MERRSRNGVDKYLNVVQLQGTRQQHVPVKVSLDRSIEEQYDLLDLEVRLLQADRGIVLKY
jgi:hypothetical protein